MEVSAVIFNKKGSASPTISEISNVTGYSKDALHPAFTVKDELYLEAFKYNFSTLKKELVAQVHNPKSRTSKLLTIPDLKRNRHVDQRVLGACPILYTAIEVDKTNTKMNEQVEQAFSNWKNSILVIIHKGTANNEFKQELNAEELALGIKGNISLAKTFQQHPILKININRLKNSIQENL